MFFSGPVFCLTGFVLSARNLGDQGELDHERRMTREEWEYWAQDMKVRTVKLPDSDEKKAVLKEMMRTFEEMFALYDEVEDFDPDMAQRFIVRMAKVFEEARDLA
jgi:hypothetical protein